MKAKQQNKGELAFAYKCKFDQLSDMLHRNDKYRLERKHAINANVYVTGINENNEVTFENRLFLTSNNFVHINYAKLELAIANDELQLDSIAERISRSLIIQQAAVTNPIFRFKSQRIPMAEEVGCRPWHHMMFAGDKVYCYVWDTRVVEKVLTIEQTSEFCRRMFKEAVDNNEPLIFTPETEQYKAEFELMLPSTHPILRTSNATEELEAALANEPQS